MRGGGGAQGGGQTDQTTNFFWLLCLVFGVVIGIWWFKRQWIIEPIFWMRLHEITLLYYLTLGWNHLVTLLPWLHLHPGPTNELIGIRDYIINTPPEKVQFAAFSYINSSMGRWVRFPAALILLILAIVVGSHHTSARFKRTFNTKALQKQESENWPQIKPVLSLDLLKEDLDTGAWAMAKLPFDFCKEHHLLTVEEEEGKKIWKLESNAAHGVFVMQMGPLWAGMSNLPIHLQALAVIFISRILKERAVGDRLLTQIAISAASGKLDFTGVTEGVKKYHNCKPLRWVESRHAYVGTVMATLLELARADGVLASAEFLWLKPVDRRMWYMLNSVGRQTAVVEVAGLFSHWLTEKEFRRGMKTPMVKQAVEGLAIAIKEKLYIGEGETWQLSSAA